MPYIYTSTGSQSKPRHSPQTGCWYLTTSWHSYIADSSLNQLTETAAIAGLNKGTSLDWDTAGNTGLLGDRCSNLAAVAIPTSSIVQKPLQGQPCKFETPWLDLPASLCFLLSLFLFWLVGLGFFLKWWNTELVVCIMLISLEVTSVQPQAFSLHGKLFSSHS